MTPGIVTPVIVLLSGISLTGCALPGIETVQNEPAVFDAVYLETLSELEPGELLNYQQQRYQLEDPLGDHALLNLLHLTATDVLWNTLTGQGYAEILDEINALRNDFEYHPIALDRFAFVKGHRPGTFDTEYLETWSKTDDVFKRVISQEQQNGISPTPGICHRWSYAYRKNPQSDTVPYIYFSKLLWALAYGESSSYFVTETEAQLAQWVVDQALRSVTLEEIFRQSYRLNAGDVYLSLLTAANVFSRFWYLPDREDLAIATRLKLITAGQNGEGDNFGAWHHFWGLSLFGYCHGEKSSRFVGWIESLGSGMVTDHNEVDEDYINRHAGEAGARLRKLIEHWPGGQIVNRTQPCDQASSAFAFRR